MAKDPTKEQVAIMSAVYDEAITNALVGGMGLIKIICNGRDIEFSAVSPEEYRDMAEVLIWADRYKEKVPVQ